MIDIAIAAAFVILFIGTQYFWMKHTQTLVNKLMSRNYTEFVQSENLLKRKRGTTEHKIQMPPDGSNELGVLNDFLGN